MSYGFLDIAVTPSVCTAQAVMGAEYVWQDFKGHREFHRFTDGEAAFIAARDSFYVATVSETGWPYMQHRGVPPGFLPVVNDRTLAFADYRGNRQYISVGNVASDDRGAENARGGDRQAADAQSPDVVVAVLIAGNLEPGRII